VVQKQLGDWFDPQRMLFMMSKEKNVAIGRIAEMRQAMLEVLERSEVISKMQNKDPHEDPENPTDLLAYFVKANKACGFKGAELSEKIVDDVMTLYLVMDNMVKQLSAMFIHLGDYPDVYRKMAQEIRETEIQDFQSLSKLEYTEKVILEALRFSPALQRGTRLSISPDGAPAKVGNYILPNRTQIHFFTYSIHHDGDIWENPEVFDPERWRDGFSPAPYTYMPFFAGPRGCLGKHFAMMAMKLTLSVFLRNFEFEQMFGGKPPEIDKGMAVMRIRDPVPYRLTPIN